MFRDCFNGIRGSIRYLYTRAGLHQHVVLEQRLQLPPGFSDKTRLELYTEFAPNTPLPRINTDVLRSENDPVLRAQMVEPDFLDSELDFGESAMRNGMAFAFGDAAETQPIRVGKRFQMISGRPVLTEAVEWKQLEPLLARLAAVERPKTGLFAVNSSRQVKRAVGQARLPREHFRALDRENEIQLASSPLSQPAVIVDYELLSSAANTTLKGDTTYYVSGVVNLSGATRLEGGTVIKFTNSSSAKITITSTIDCQTAAYRPAIFTSNNENLVGETISGSTGNASNYPNGLVISTAGSVLHDLRFSYATNGVTLDFAAGQINLTNVQFVNCQDPIDSSANDENTIIVDNSLFHHAKYGIKGGRDLIVRGQHVTAHQCEEFAHSQTSGGSYAYLTNCLLVAVTNWGSDFTFTTNSTVYYATDPGGIFQTVGAGAHYLVTNRDTGTTNISAGLLAALKKKTTYPPIVLSNITVFARTNLVPQAPRDTNNFPDIGFEYDPIDYLTYWFTVSNATLTVSAGTAIACYNDTGIWIADGSSIVSIGTPLAPNWFTRYTCVQEQPLALGSSTAFDVNSAHYASAGPTGVFQFCKFTCPAGEAYHFYHYDYDTNYDRYAFGSLSIRDCEFWNGLNYLGGSISRPGSATVKNNLFHRSPVWAYNASSSQTLLFSNNLVFGVSAALYGPASDSWKVYDNAFDTCTFFLPAHLITNGYNAYINCANRLSPTNAHDIVLANFAYAAGPLGDFYQPTNSALINTGSLTSAGLAGLYHYTTTTNQVKETNSIVDIGYHYVTVSNGLPVDTDGDGQADYFEDTNGNGIFNAGDFGDFSNFLFVPSWATNFQSITEDEAEKFDRPDAMGAVGPNHFMAVLNFVVKVYDKSNGQPLVTNSLDGFLGLTIASGQYQGTYPDPQDPDFPNTGDPRVLYDNLSGRWFACGRDGPSGNVLLTISTNSDPVGNGGATWVSDNWTNYLVPMAWVGGKTNYVDQPKLAVDSNGVYIASFAPLIHPLTENNNLRIAAMPKGQFLNFSASVVPTNFIFDCPSNVHAQIAASIDPITTNDPIWLIDVSTNFSLYYNQIKWTNGFSSAPGYVMTNWGQLSITQSYQNIDATTSAPQLGGTNARIDLVDTRLLMASLRTIDRTQYLWTCHHVWVNRYGTNGTLAADRSTVEWFKIQTTPYVSIADSGRIFDTAAENPKHYYYPSLAVNRNGDMVIGFSGSSSNDFVGAYYWGKLHNGTSLSAPIRYYAGKDWVTNNQGVAYWGDYSHTTVDPVDGLTIWTIQEYAETRTSGIGYYTYTWGTRVAAVRPY